MAQHHQFLPQSRDILGHFQHGFILLGDVVLEVSDLFLEGFKKFARHGARIAGRWLT